MKLLHVDRAFANRDSTTYTYELFWKTGYYPTFHDWKSYVDLTTIYFQTTSKIDFHSITAFNSSSAGATLKVGFETPRFLQIYKTDLSAELYITENTFAGDVSDTLGFEEYQAGAGLLHLYLNDIVPLVTRIDFGIEKLKGGDLDGYTIGLGAGFSF